MSAIIMSGQSLQRKARTIVSITAGVRQWHGHQSKVMRSPATARQWYEEQAAGEGLVSLYRCFHLRAFQVLKGAPRLHHMGFILPGGDEMTLASLVAQPADPGTNPGIQDGDSWAELASTLSFHICKSRLQSLRIVAPGGLPWQACLRPFASIAFCCERPCAHEGCGACMG